MKEGSGGRGKWWKREEKNCKKQGKEVKDREGTDKDVTGRQTT